MGKKVTGTMSYDAAPEAVYAMFTDPAYIKDKNEKTGGSNVTVDVKEDGGGHVLVVTRELPTDSLPSVAKKFTGDSIKTTETDTWGEADADGTRSGTINVEFSVPMSINGDLTMAKAGSGTVVTVSVEVKAKVPLVGGKLEGVAAEQFFRALGAEEKIGKAILEGA